MCVLIMVFKCGSMHGVTGVLIGVLNMLLWCMMNEVNEVVEFF